MHFIKILRQIFPKKENHNKKNLNACWLKDLLADSKGLAASWLMFGSIRVCVSVKFSFFFFLFFLFVCFCLFISICYIFEYVHSICLFTCMCMLLRHLRVA